MFQGVGISLQGSTDPLEESDNPSSESSGIGISSGFRGNVGSSGHDSTWDRLESGPTSP